MAGKRSDFFDGLGETLSRTARDLGAKAETLYETQKLKGKISSEERVIARIKENLGNILYQRYQAGEELPEDCRPLCSQIVQHEDCIREYEKKLADIKKKKVCPSCKKEVEQSAAFCPFCGAACPDEEPEEDARDVVHTISPEEVKETEAEEGKDPASETE